MSAEREREREIARYCQFTKILAPVAARGMRDSVGNIGRNNVSILLDLSLPLLKRDCRVE